MAAAPLSVAERDDLIAVAVSLPDSWVAALEPPYGQLAITPVDERRRYHRCWVASAAARRLARDLSC
jgi:hypothetical protein